MKKLSNTEAELKKSVTYKNSVYFEYNYLIRKSISRVFDVVIFSVGEILLRKDFWVESTQMNCSTITAKTTYFKLCTHIYNKLLHKKAPVFSNKEISIFHCSISSNFESVFWTKLFKKYLERRKWRARLCLDLGKVHFNEKKCWKI